MQFLIYNWNTALEQHGSILLTVFIAGLIGGSTHCAGTCSTFIFTKFKNENYKPYIKRITGAAILPYHLGRMTTYIVLAICATLLAQQLIDTRIHQDISFALLVLAGLIFITSAIPSLKPELNLKFRILNNLFGKLSSPLLNNPSTIKQYLLGVLLGFLPCGLIYASLIISSTTRDVFTAIISMSFFTAGTIPSMFIVGIGKSLRKKQII